MSLAMPRIPAAGGTERASVVLPTVKCSSCAVAIPLNALGEHVCAGRPPMPSRPHLPPVITKESASPPMPQRGFAPTPQGIHRSNAPGALLPPDPHGFLMGDVVAPPASRFGDYPADVPLSAVSETSMGRWPIGDSPSGHILPSPTLPDTTSGGFAGMAGVGRRAFAAAAWSVRAGVALANGASNGSSPSGYESPADSHESISMPVPTPSSSTADRSLARSPPRSSPPKSSPPLDRSGSRPNNRSPTPREPVILPKAPLAGRQRSNTIRDGNRSVSRQNDRSVSRQDDRSASRQDDRPRFENRSASRLDDYRAPSRAQIDQRSASAMSHRQAGDEPSPFFERYKQVIGSKSDQTHMGSTTRWTKDDDENSVGSMEDDSQLPWVTSPENEHVHRFDHQRNLTSGSLESATSSSASCGPPPRSGGHEELVMTPNQSWEGLTENNALLAGGTKGLEIQGLGLGGDSLAQIGEEDEDDEGERFVMGRPHGKKPLDTRSDVTATPTFPQRAMEPARMPQVYQLDPPRVLPLNTSRSSPSDSRRPRRSCASCGDAVGGSRRFVERDGVILCEADWKKLYLPPCRRCQLPIEKSAVSSSDGQLKGKWHRACFTCTRCDRPFDGDDFYVHDGRPWCAYHYAEENGTLCAASSCGKPIEGGCILAPGSNGSSDMRFHPGHLRCEHRGGASGSQNCRESMNEYYEVGGERFCERHSNEAVRRMASSGGRAEKRRTLLVDLSPIAGGLTAAVRR